LKYSQEDEIQNIVEKKYDDLDDCVECAFIVAPKVGRSL
jgi:hypothetical protein